MIEVPQSGTHPDIWPEVKELTPEYAQYLLDNCTYDRQRTLKSGQIRRYIRDIQDGNFAVSEIRLLHWKDKIHMTNGQHRCEAVIKAGQPITVVLTHIKAKSEEEVHKDYFHADSGIVRSNADKLGAIGAAEKLGVAPHQIVSISAATNGIINLFDYKDRHRLSNTPDELLNALWVWGRHGRDYLEAITQSDKKMYQILKRKGVMGVGMITCRYQSELARKFWRTISDDNGLLKGSPEKALLDYLRENPPNSATLKSVALKTAYCWNAYIEEREVKRLFVKTEQEYKPIRIVGTPLDGSEEAEQKLRLEVLKS